jgi:hypothetical protein
VSDPSESRRRAWATRRAKYGQVGHAGDYGRWSADPIGRRALALVVQLHREAVLSEGQCCQALGIDRISFREIVDAAPEPAAARDAMLKQIGEG